MEAKDKIRALIQDILKRRGDFQAFDDQDSLIFSGRIDSLNVLEIVGFLEQQFRVDISEMEFDPTQFDSLESIAALV
jgi:acyl carrier protein